MFHTVCIIADMLVKLHELGCVQFIDWQLNFSFKCELKKLENEQKNMSEQLSRWNEAIDSARNDCHVLNSFTMKQLLHLRKELRPQLIEGEVSFSVTEQTYSLLQCLHPCIEPHFMKETLKEAWRQSESDLIGKVTISETEVREESGDFKSLSVQEIAKKLTKEQHGVYVELVETNGIDALWSIAEILSRKQSSIDTMATEILQHIANVTEEGEVPCENELMDIIRLNVDLKVESTSIKRKMSEISNSEGATGQPKHLEK